MKGSAKTELVLKIEAACTSLYEKQELDSVVAFFAPDYRVNLTDGPMSGGHELVRRFLGALFRSFPQLKVEVEILADKESDRVVWLRTFRGVQRGAVQGFPASDREIVWRDMVTTCFRDGLIVEEWIVSDLVERLIRSRKQT